MKVPDVRNLVPDTWTGDGEGALPKLGPCPHDNSCVGCRRTEMATSRFFCVEFDDIVEVCWPTLIKSWMVLRRGAFFCVGWQVTLCDSIWQAVALLYYVWLQPVGFREDRAINTFNILNSYSLTLQIGRIISM